MSNFIGMVYGVLKDKGFDTKGMSVDEAVEKYKLLEGDSKEFPAKEKPTHGQEKIQELREVAENYDAHKLGGEKVGRGYVGQSMSENARRAYGIGEKPLSRWKLNDFKEEIKQELDLNIKKIKGSYKDYLKNTSWHHTGKFFNVTDFYSVDADKIIDGIKSGDIELFSDEEVAKMKEIENKKFEESIRREEERKKRAAEKEQRIEKHGLGLIKGLPLIERTTKSGKKAYGTKISSERYKEMKDFVRKNIAEDDISDYSMGILIRDGFRKILEEKGKDFRSDAFRLDIE